MNRFLMSLNQAKSVPLVIAHRGDSSYAPENTLEAIFCGHSAGADACEIDVQLTRDQRVVVIHDDSLVRTTNVSERYHGDIRALNNYLVREFDLGEIKLLDAGSWFLNAPYRFRSAGSFATIGKIKPEHAALYRSGQVRVPTLLEVLTLIKQLDWLVNVEIKVTDEVDGLGLLNAVIHEINTTGMSERVLISSFDPEVVASAASRRLPIATGILTTSRVSDTSHFVREVIGADAFHTSWEGLGDPTNFGFPVLVYTVNDVSEGGAADRMARWPVDAIFTDDPAGMVARFRELAAMK